jgi:hypothetical protein
MTGPIPRLTFGTLADRINQITDPTPANILALKAIVAALMVSIHDRYPTDHHIWKIVGDNIIAAMANMESEILDEDTNPNTPTGFDIVEPQE